MAAILSRERWVKMWLRRKPGVVSMPHGSSLVASEVVKWTNPGSISDKKVDIMVGASWIIVLFT